MQAIQNWLHGSRNFYVGKAIYSVIGDNPAISALLEQGETLFAQSKLTDYLVNFSMERLTKSTSTQQPDQMPESDNAILIALKNEWQPLYQKMNYLRHCLDKKFEDENSADAIAFRGPIAKQILEIEKQVMLVWDKRDHYLQHGALPFEKEIKTEIPTDPFELAALLTSIKKNIRYNRKKLADHPDNAKYASLLAHYRQLHIDITGKKYEEKT